MIFSKARTINFFIILFVTIVALACSFDFASAASYDDVPRIRSGWSIDADKTTGVNINTFDGASHVNKTNKKYYQKTVSAEKTTNRSITGTLSSEISSGLTAKGEYASGTLAAKVTASIGVTLSSSYTYTTKMYPTSTKYGKNYINPNTKWSTKVISIGTVLSGYAKRYSAYIVQQKGSFNVKMPTGFRNVYTYTKI